MMDTDEHVLNGTLCKQLTPDNLKMHEVIHSQKSGKGPSNRYDHRVVCSVGTITRTSLSPYRLPHLPTYKSLSTCTNLKCSVREHSDLMVASDEVTSLL